MREKVNYRDDTRLEIELALSHSDNTTNAKTNTRICLG